MITASATDLAGAVSSSVLAALAVVGALFATVWWFRRLRIVALIDENKRVHIWLSNQGREVREVVSIKIVAVRSPLSRLDVRAEGGDDYDEVLVQQLEQLKAPIRLDRGQGELVKLTLTGEPVALPRRHAPGIEKREPTIDELRVAIYYGDGKRALRLLKKVEGLLVG